MARSHRSRVITGTAWFSARAYWVLYCRTAMPRAKIVCTLGPASSTPERIGELIDAGMNVARLNFSHGSHEDHARTLQIVRAEADKPRQGDRGAARSAGPEDPRRQVREGPDRAASRRRVHDHHRHERDRRREARLDDVHAAAARRAAGRSDPARRRLPRRSRSPRSTTARSRRVVVTGGVLKNNKGINLPGVEVSAPALSEKDRTDIGFGAALRRRLRRAVVRAPARGRDRGQAPAARSTRCRSR